MSDHLENKIEKISEMSQSGAGKSAQMNGDAQETVAPDKVKFDAAMESDPISQAKNTEESLKTSLMEEIRNLHRQVDATSRSSPEQLGKQVDTVIAQIDDLKTKLSTPNLELKHSVQNILQNKLDHIDGNLKVALDKAGLEYPAASKPIDEQSARTPITRYLDYLTDGQEKLGMLGSEVGKLSAEGKTFSPADMLAMQIKVGYVQQELEFFTSLLNKALESTKTIMNVQV